MDEIPVFTGMTFSFSGHRVYRSDLEGDISPCCDFDRLSHL